MASQEGRVADAGSLYRQCIDVANVCIERVRNGEESAEYPAVAAKSNAQAALALIQAAVTINKAANEATAARATSGRPPHRRT